jgi:hypothetical protein
MILNITFGDSVCCEGGHVGLTVLDHLGAELLTMSLILCYRCYTLLVKQNGTDKKCSYNSDLYGYLYYTAVCILFLSYNSNPVFFNFKSGEKPVIFFTYPRIKTLPAYNLNSDGSYKAVR